MQANVPPSNDPHQPDDRQQRLEDFIANALDGTPGQRLDDVLIVARSPASAVARALFTLSAKLAARASGARIVFASSPAMAAGETWQMSFDQGFAHEIRIVANPRFLAAHEQLVIGEAAVWYGDSMRRDPDKRDAFASWSHDAAESLRARQTFTRLWRGAEPLYAHHLDVGADGSQTQQQGAMASQVLAAETIDALKTWGPINRH